MAGYEADDWYWNPRGNVKPPEELLKLVFPFVDFELERLEAMEEMKHVTALCTLRYFKYLRMVVLQDAAAMLVLHPERRDHGLWSMPVFRTTLFKVQLVVFVELFFYFTCLTISSLVVGRSMLRP